MKRRLGLVATFIFVAAVFTVVFFSVGAVGCKMTEAGIELYSREVSSPQIVSFTVESESEMRLECTKEVKVSDLKVSGIEDAKFEVSGKNVLLTIPEGTEVGKTYVLEGVAYDVDGSSLTFALSFIGYNNRPATLVISEVRSEAGKSSAKDTSKGVYSEEFIEFLCIGEGNLSGLEIISGSDGEEKKYVFPEMEVAKGDYITVHFRCRDDLEKTTICIDETTGDKTLATHKDSCDEAWDLWVKNDGARIGITDVIVLRNGFTGKLIDAVCYSESSVTKWKNEFIGNLAKRTFEEGFWSGGSGVEFAALSLGMTTTRTISRQDLDFVLQNGFRAGSKDCWKVTATSTATPGKPNSSKEYVPK